MHTLPPLPYDYSALEPFIDSETMQIHHTKHHQAYIDKLNNVLREHPSFSSLEVDDLLKQIDNVPEEIRQDVENNGGGHANHSLFWQILRAPIEGNSPKGKILEAINANFGNFEEFKSQFSQKALSLFGSGWVFLTADKDNSLKIKRHSFQNSPLMHGNTPLLGLDLWEHAYYLKYQNRKAEYVDAWWNLVNWDKVEDTLNASINR